MTYSDEEFNHNNYDSSRDRSRSGYRYGSRGRHKSRDENRLGYRGGSIDIYESRDENRSGYRGRLGSRSRSRNRSSSRDRYESESTHLETGHLPKRTFSGYYIRKSYDRNSFKMNNFNNTDIFNKKYDRIDEGYDRRDRIYNYRDERYDCKDKGNSTNQYHNNSNYHYNSSNSGSASRSENRISPKIKSQSIDGRRYDSKDYSRLQTKETILKQNELSKGIISNSKDNSRSQTKEIILEQDELSEGIIGFKKFIETYAKESIGFPYACHHIGKGNITSETIANFVNEGAKLLRSNSFNETNDSNTFKQIATKIGQLIVNGKIKLDSFKPQELANTFNGLGKCYINLGKYLNTLEPKDKNNFIGALVDRIKDLLNKKDSEEEFNFKSQELANTFNGLAKCHINLGEYLNTLELEDKNKFIGALVDRIKDLLPKDDFNSQAIANTFNGLAQCGINLGGYVNNDFIGALVGKIQKLLKGFNSIDIANTFNGLAQCGINLGGYLNKSENEKLKNDFIGALVGRIKTLLEQEQFNSIGIANTFNGLAKGGINLGEYLNTLKLKDKNKFIGTLVGEIKDLLLRDDFNSQAIANTFNGLAQCGINLGGYVNNDFIGALVGKIQKLLKGFNSIDIANTFNGLAQCGINLDEYFKTKKEDEKNAFIGALVGKIQKLLKGFNSQELANIFNGLVSLFLYNKDLYEKNRSQFKNIINNLVQKYLKLSNKDDQSNWTMLYNIKYLQVCGFEIDEEILHKITNLKTTDLNNNHTNSALEKKFKNFLRNFGLKNKKTEKFETKDGCYELESKLTFQVTSNALFKKPVDFYIEFKHEDKIYKTYIELDGPSHFTEPANQLLLLTLYSK